MSILEQQRQNKINADKAAAYDKMLAMQEEDGRLREARESGVLEAVEYMLRNNSVQGNPQPKGFAESAFLESDAEELVDYSSMIGSEQPLSTENPWDSV